MSLPQNKHECIFTARMNIYYHERRERHYTLWVSMANVTAVLGSAVAALALGGFMPAIGLDWAREPVVAVATLFVSVSNGVVLALGMHEKARVHADFRRRWTHLLVSAEFAKDDAPSIDRVKREFAEISAAEPAPIERLLADATAYAKRVMGLESEVPPAKV